MTSAPVLKLTLRSGAETRQFNAVLALTLEAKERGLMHRLEPLGPEEAMLFVLDPPEYASFWMKNTLIPLDLAYFDASGRLVSCHHMNVEADPENPRRAYHAGAPVKFALEAAFGSLKGLEPSAGWQLQLDEPVTRALVQAGL